MKKRIFAVFLIFLVGTMFAFSGWKDEVKVYLGAVKDYDGLLNYLISHFSEIPGYEKPQATLLTAYCFYVQNRLNKEYLWIKKYFNEYGAPVVEFDFLPVVMRVKLLQYRTEWLDKFPGIKKMNLNEKSIKFQYYFRPSFLIIDLSLYSLSNYILLDSEGKTIKKGEFAVKNPQLEIPVDEAFFKRKKHLYTLKMVSGNYENDYSFSISISYSYPDDVIFSPVDGKIKIKGKDFKPEEEERIKIEKRKYFDGRYFKKKALPYYISGIVFYVGEKKGLDSVYKKDISPTLQSAVDESRYLVKTFYIGFSLKAIYETVKSYKTEIKRIPYKVKLEDAIEWNNKLRSEIEEKKKDVFVLISLSKEGRKK